MREASINREIEKCREILQDKRIKNINKVSITKYLESLKEELYGSSQ